MESCEACVESIPFSAKLIQFCLTGSSASGIKDSFRPLYVQQRIFYCMTFPLKPNISFSGGKMRYA